ncbi:MAG: helix-turn-helix transcriptional regulator [Sneathiella sp.]|uniref:AraC family transcriptional regulator n=1 Tax=Sneathiella sp. TaxID=1964365 RepID=UPI00300227E3
MTPSNNVGYIERTGFEILLSFMAKTIAPAEYKTDDFLERPITLRAFDMEAGDNVAPHRHKWGQLAYASTGVMTVTTEDGRWMVPQERAVWIPPDISHSVQTNAQLEFRSVHIAASHSNRLTSQCRVIKVSPLLKALIFRAVDIPKNYESDTANSRIMEVILDQIEEAEDAPLHLPMPTDSRLLRIAEILLSNPANVESLEKLAKSSGASERTLARLFKKETGLTFGKWRQQRRLLAGISLLTEGQPVTNVALDLGYESVSAFIAMFKSALGTTPSRYLTKNNSLQE